MDLNNYYDKFENNIKYLRYKFSAKTKIDRDNLTIKDDSKDYNLDIFNELKNNLNKAKDKLDVYTLQMSNDDMMKEFGTTNVYELRNKVRNNKKIYDIINLSYYYSKLTNKIYLMSFKNDIKYNYNTKICTNAWLKCMELIVTEKLINVNEGDTFSHLGSAELPGNFLLAVNHYLKTHYKKINYDWHGSSFMPDPNNPTSTILEDIYDIWKNNPERWLMGVEMNGNVKKVENLEYIENKLKEGKDLYTSDGGISLNYNEFALQEKIELDLKLGEILLGLMVLKKGGSMFVKIYTIFERFTVELIILVSYLFEEFYITKPFCSKQANSELYIVGKGYKGKNIDVINLLKTKLKEFEKHGVYVDKKMLNNIEKEDLEYLHKIARDIFELQIIFINRNIYYFEKYVRNNIFNYKYIDKIITDVYYKYIKDKINKYYDKFVSDYDMRKLEDDDKQIIKKK
jgi:hypothetical protein